MKTAIRKGAASINRSAHNIATDVSVMGFANVIFSLFASLLFLILFLVCWRQPSRPLIWNSFLIATGSLATGAVLGFLYSSFGDENERFKPVFSLINGALGGAAITDLAKNNSLIRTYFWSLAKACGITDGIAIVSMVVLTFAALGFLAMYYNRKLLLNPASAEADRRVTSFAKTDPATADPLRRFWMPDGEKPDPANEKKLRDWMTAHNLGNIKTSIFLNDPQYAEQRKAAASEFKLI